MEIRPITAADYPQIAAIYVQGIATGNASFQTEAPTWKAWDSSHLPSCRIAAFEGNTMLGWAALSPVSSRCVYAGVAEVSVYIGDGQRGRGIGKILLQQLIEESEQASIWTLQAGIFPENAASIALHTRCGFRQVGYRERIGKMKATGAIPCSWSAAAKQ
jgi:phosphinothricin acetyltransferase